MLHKPDKLASYPSLCIITVSVSLLILLLILYGCNSGSGGSDGDGDSDTLTYYLDADEDGCGDPSVSIEAEAQPAGYVLDNTDCDDTDPLVNPNATEICDDTVDNDCNGNPDCDDSLCSCSSWYYDSDGDGYGDPGNLLMAVFQPPGFVVDNTDCNDSNVGIHPGAEEIFGDGIDQDCDDYDPISMILSNHIIRVPSDEPTIQSGIDAAENGDAILVSAGIYYENIDFKGKGIIVQSETGPDETTINGNRSGQVVVFWNGENNDSILHGFSIENGLPPETAAMGGGVSIRNSSPSVTSCIIKKNGASNGGGIYVEGELSSPIIENNLVLNNIGTELGGGFEIRDGASPILRNNIIEQNVSMIGSAIEVANGASPTIDGNTLINNRSGCDLGFPFDANDHLDGIDVTEDIPCGDRFPGTLFIADHSEPVIRNNYICNNLGGGVGILLFSNATLEDNTISNNNGGMPLTGGLLIALDSTVIMNENIIENNQSGAIWIDDTSFIMDSNQNVQNLEGYDFREDTDIDFSYNGNWDIGLNNIYSGGTRMASGGVGDSVDIQFSGTGVALVYFAFPGHGIAGVEIDGVSYPPLDTYAPSQLAGKAEQVIATNLPPSNHVLTITVTGNKNPLSSDSGIVIDAIGVLSNTPIGNNTINGSVYLWPPSPQTNTVVTSTTIHYVPNDYATIQAAVDAASDGDTIVVLPGIYYGHVDFSGKEISLQSQDPTNIDIVQSTIIESNIELPTVFFARGESRSATLNGFTVRNVHGKRAIHICQSSPTISNNIVQDSPSGGVSCDYAFSPLIKSNKIERNAADMGSAIEIYLSSPEIRDNLIANNLRSGINSYFSWPIISNNTIRDNTANEGMESAIFLDHFSIGIIKKNMITDNRAQNISGGNGIYFDCFSNSTVIGNSIVNNDGTGLFIFLDSSPEIINNVIADNKGAAVHTTTSRPIFIHNTIVGHEHGIHTWDISKVTVQNTILSNEYDIGLGDHAEVSVSYSVLNSEWPGEGNIFSNPGLVGNGDYHLLESSPCIDAGVDAGVYQDRDTNLRPQGNGFDIGAYEFLN